MGSTTSSPTSSVQEVDVGGYRLHIECKGEGSPTVVFVSGAGGDRSALSPWVDVGELTRVCSYDRAGIGSSDERPETGSTTLGDLADELARLLQGAAVVEPIVIVSHSLGGGVTQFYADRYPDRVAGLVFIDPIAIPGYVDWFGPEVDDGTGGTIDMERTAKDWERLGSFGSTPLFVLTQNFQGDDDLAPPRFRRYFRDVHDELAGRSSDALHVIAVDSGHTIHETSPDLVTDAATEIIEAVRSGEGLAPCDDRFEDLGGACA
jgi:pimeloyl-ACP methyl ester carboxylesterase